MKRTTLELLRRRTSLRSRGRRDQRLLHAVQAQQSLNAKNGIGPAPAPRPVDGRLAHLGAPHD